MEPAESVKNFGVTLDADNSMQRHGTNLCHICYYYLWELQRVYRYLNPQTAVKVANALVNSWTTAIHCSITQKDIYWETSKSSKYLQSQYMQTKQIQSCDTLPMQSTLASHLVPYIVQIQPSYF